MGVVKQSFWPGVSFTDIDDLNRKAHAWCERINSRIHRTTHERPCDRRRTCATCSTAYGLCLGAICDFGAASVSWDGYLSYDGVLYGLPSDPKVTGTVVQVRERRGMLSVWSGGRLLAELAKRPRSQEIVTHPDQFRTVAEASIVARTDGSPGTPAASSSCRHAIPCRV